MMKVAVKGQIERLVYFLVRQQLVDRAERSWWHEILGCERLYLGMCVWRLASEKVGLLYLVSADDLHEGDFCFSIDRVVPMVDELTFVR